VLEIERQGHRRREEKQSKRGNDIKVGTQRGRARYGKMRDSEKDRSTERAEIERYREEI